MKNTLLVLLLLTAIVNAQNKVVIKNTFFNQNIDEFDALAIKNGVKAGDDVFMWVNFKSDAEGSVYGLELDERSKIFEPAITAIITKIPTLDPNEYLKKGKVMKYSVKLNFKLSKKNEVKRRAKNGAHAKIKLKHFYIKEFFPVKWIALDAADNEDKNDLSLIDEVPVHENCKTIVENLEIKKCLQQTIQRHIGMKFDTSLASSLGLAPGRQKIIVKFIISKEGEIVNITCEANHEKLKEEGIRVINLIPDFYKPGAIDGKPVNVNYTTPITILVE